MIEEKVVNLPVEENSLQEDSSKDGGIGELLQLVKKLEQEIEELKAKAAPPVSPVPSSPETPKRLFGSSAGVKKGRIEDTRTGILYDSRSAAGKALAAEGGFNPKESTVWYRVLNAKANRGRFVEVLPDGSRVEL